MLTLHVHGTYPARKKKMAPKISGFVFKIQLSTESFSFFAFCNNLYLITNSLLFFFFGRRPHVLSQGRWKSGNFSAMCGEEELQELLNCKPERERFESHCEIFCQVPLI